MNRISFVWMMGALLLAGCRSGESDRPEIGTVKGTVTMDGNPLPQAMVVFAPASGRSSTAVTNDHGEYNLLYLNNLPGAKLGEHKVTITTYLEDEDNPKNAKFKEKIPAKYNRKSILTADVKAGKNEVDFELKTK